MRELFDKLIAEGEAGIDRLVADRTQETVTLDFKEAQSATTGALTNDDRKNLAKALSAFANSAGGLLVFGVEARKGADGVDCAQSAKPVPNIDRFKSEAITATGQLLQPRHDGIVVEAIPSQKQHGAGYLLVDVERSERRPHRSEASGQKQYFKRAGDSSFEMEHYDIEDAFRRTSAPDISLLIMPSGRDISGGRTLHKCGLYLLNNGRFTARHPYVHIQKCKKCSVHGEAGETFNRSYLAGWHALSGSSDDVINPGISIRCGTLIVTETNDQYIHIDFIVQEHDVVEFYWRYGCEDVRMKEGKCSFEWHAWDRTEMKVG